MKLFGRSPDPIREHERKLNAQMAELQAQIASLNQQIQTEQAQPRLRSTAQPHAPPAPAQPVAAPADPAFEEVSHQKVTNPFGSESTASHYNELGVRKYDPLAILRKWWSQLRGTATSNPTLVRYLAAGNVEGLKVLRYEKRVARNRFFALCGLFIALIWGLVYFYYVRRP
jgi:hypothetical protein